MSQDINRGEDRRNFVDRREDGYVKPSTLIYKLEVREFLSKLKITGSHHQIKDFIDKFIKERL